MWRDQGAIKESLQNLLACAAFDVFGEPVDSTLGVVDGMGQHVSKAYIYFAMAFSFAVEMLNIKMRARREKPSPPVDLRSEY